MSRIPLAYSAADISALARSLRSQLAEHPEPPGHVVWLNMLAKAAGCRNFQHFQSQAAAREKSEREPAPPAPPEAPVDAARIFKVARCFDAAGMMARWPSKLSEQRLCIWVIWSRIEAGRVMTEKEVNQALTRNHLFGDYALLRRELCDMQLMARTPDGREYRRLEQQPPPEALALLRHLKSRETAAPEKHVRQGRAILVERL